MIPHSDSTHGETRQASPVFHWGVPASYLGRRCLWLVLAILMFLLGEAMVHSRFFQGSRNRHNGTVGQ